MFSWGKFRYTAFLCIFILLGTSEGTIPKSSLFLHALSVPGDPPGFGIYQDPAVLKTAGAHKVLFGHYSSLLEERDDENSIGSGRTLTGRSLLDPSSSDVDDSILKILDAYQTNFRSIIQNAANLTSMGKSAELTQQLEQCQDEISKCKFVPEVHLKCGVNCLGKAHPLINGLTNLVLAFLETLCQPKRTAFEQIYDFGKRNFNQFRGFRFFLEMFKAGKQDFGDVAMHAVQALMPIIIEKVQTDMMPFRTVSKELDEAVRAAEQSHPPTDAFTANRLCLAIDDRAAAINLVDVFYKDPSLVDALLGGLSVMNLVSKYVPGQFQLPFAASLEGVRILTGQICGLVYSSATGSKIPCDELGGFPTSGVPLPNVPGVPMDDLCVEDKVANYLLSEDSGNDDATPGRVRRSLPPSGSDKIQSQGRSWKRRRSIVKRNVKGRAGSTRGKRLTLIVGKKIELPMAMK